MHESLRHDKVSIDASMNETSKAVINNNLCMIFTECMDTNTCTKQYTDTVNKTNKCIKNIKIA